MPYIKQEKREWFDPLLMAMIPDDLGELTYCIYILCAGYISRKGMRYENIAGVAGSLTCTIQELYRRLAVPYEDSKIQENGDV